MIVVFIFLLLLPFYSHAQPERCATMQVDSLRRATIPNAPSLMDFENWMQQKIVEESAKRRASVVYTIPVVVHVIHNGDAVGTNENISQAQILSQIDVLNEDFRRLNADAVNTPSAFQSVAADAEIEFCLAQIDPDGNLMPEPGIDRVNAGQSNWSNTNDIDNTLKPATIWDPTQYYNMWTVDFGSTSLLGYAQFPDGSGLAGMPNGTQNSSTDGVVMSFNAFGRVGNVSSPYDLGRTTTHEVGHSFGLRHIWGDGGCGVDDYCNDTPVSDDANYGCLTSHVSCSSTDMVQNYMDYSDDNCMNIFTEDQKTRMQTVLLNSPRRVELINSTVCQVINEYTVTGQVRDAQTLLGIPQARVRLTNLNYDFTATADANGNFTISDVPEGTYTAYGGQWGYVTGTLQNVEVESGISPVIIEIDEGYYDDFVLDFNWSVSGNSSTGIWERGTPIGTNNNGVDCNSGEDVNNDYGEDAYITGNGGGTAGNDDVDNGNTVLTSPVFDLSTYNEPFISYYRWFYNDGGSVTPDDELEISITNGSSTVVIETLDHNSVNSNQWNFNKILIRDFILPTATMRFILETADGATGHFVEAGLDLFKVIDSITGPNSPPITSFNADASGGCPGVIITFNDVSLNDPVSWAWSFPRGNPSNSSLQNPMVTFDNPGNYDVTLVTTNGFGSDTLTEFDYVNISNIETNFSASAIQGCPGISIDFTDESTCNPVSWEWNFPGGVPGTSNLPNPTVVYDSVGVYDVSLTVSNGSYYSTTTQADYITVSLGGTVTVLSEDFESNSFAANGWTIENPDASEGWEIVTVGGSSEGDKAARVHLYGYASQGQRDGLITPELDLTSVANASLSFEHAHRRSSTSFADSLIIYVSTDGGITYPDRIFAKAEDGSGSFATGFTLAADFVPGLSDDWCSSGSAGTSCFMVDLNAYDGVPSVKVKFETYNDKGNNIYLDNIHISGVCSSPSQPPIANFTADISAACDSLTTLFTNQTINTSTSWLWLFPGGNPLISNVENPIVTYTSPGSYDVTLIASSIYGSDTITVQNKINVYENPSVIVNGIDVSCFGDADGSAGALGSGGTAPYVYFWSTGQFLSNINNLSAGNYFITLTDAHNCLDTARVTINQPNEIILSNTITICEGDSAFAAGAYQLIAGSYYDTLSASGCDTVLITDLIVLPNTSITQNDTICEGESILAGGGLQTMDGIYYDTLIAANGCDSIRITTLTVLSNILVNEPKTICEGDGVFAGGANQTESGQYFDTLTAANGCDSIYITTLTVLPRVIVNNDTTICEGDTILLGGTFQTHPGIYSDTSSASNGCDSIRVTTLSTDNCSQQILLKIKILLSGPYDQSTGLMNDILRTNGYLPLNEPYSTLFTHYYPGGIEVIDPAVLLIADSNAIVDWIFIELRDKTDSANVVATRSALIQSDGDIVDIDGLSPVTFNDVLQDDYFVAVRHRNHLGIMTAEPVALDDTPVSLDFTNADTETYGINAQMMLGDKLALWSGDIFLDGIIKYSGSDNDRDLILIKIGGTVPTNIASGYFLEDINMDGVVKYSGVNNDRDIILVNIGGAVPTAVVMEQLPH